MAEPENQAKDVETSKIREKLVNEFGELALQIRELNDRIIYIRQQGEPLQKRANEVAAQLAIIDRGVSK